jgi:nitrite reductase (NADH) large subunit
VIRTARESLVVIGNGMAAARVVEEILTRAPDRYTITMFGAEKHGNYNRVHLSAVLGRFKDPDAILLNPLHWYEQNRIRLHAGVRAEHIDCHQRVIVGKPSANGHGHPSNFTATLALEEPYDKVIIATGSRPFVPPLTGADKPGVHVFRTIEDCAAIAEQAGSAKRAVVLGGGLLGLEAARGLLSHGVKVTVVEVAAHLMPQQLDAAAAAVLRQAMEKLGVDVLLARKVTGLLGGDHVTAVQFEDGSTLDTDLVVISCGIRPNAEIAKAAGLAVNRAIVVDDQLRTSDPNVFALGECVEHRGKLYGLVEPIYEQARVLADVLTGTRPEARYEGSRPVATLKVMGVSLVSLGEVHNPPADAQVLVDADPKRGVYRKLVVRDQQLLGAILLGESQLAPQVVRMFQRNELLPAQPLELFLPATAADEEESVATLADSGQVCNCHRVSKGVIVGHIRGGCATVGAIGEACRAGTGCGSCQPLLEQLIQLHAPTGLEHTPTKNKIELMKEAKDGLDSLADAQRYADTGNWQEMTEDDKQRFKWHGLFFRKQTPGHFMLRVRLTCGQTNARQFRVLADLSDEYGKGFADITTRQQIQLRWFTIGEVPDIWRRLDAVGLTSKQTGMDNVRGVCGCPVAGLTQHELFDGSQAARAFNERILDNREFTNLPRKFNVTITGCLENCCHTETQDIALVPAFRELNGAQVNGFNVLVGGKQGSGGYEPALPLNVFVGPEHAADLCAHVVGIFRDYGARATRNRARLRFLLDDRGVRWFRSELQGRYEHPLYEAGTDVRKPHHVDHLGIHPQKTPHGHAGPQLYYAGLLVPVGRITTAQLRGVADLAERYGNGDIRLTVQQNLIITGIPEDRLGAFTEEPLLRELAFDPSPVMRGLVACVGSDYCHFALIETKGWAVEVARELEKRVAGRKIAPLSIHWSGCPAGCGLHQVSTIGLQGCRSRVNGQVVDAAHVHVNGKAGPHAAPASDLMYDVPCEQLADALEPLVKYLPRS